MTLNIRLFVTQNVGQKVQKLLFLDCA